MKSFLQSLGVIEKDKAPVEAQAPVAAAPVAPVAPAAPKFSLGNIADEISAGTAVEVGVNPERVTEILNELHSDIENFERLDSLNTVLNAVAKLGRIPDMGQRLLTALDITGVQSMEVIDAASKYTDVAKDILARKLASIDLVITPKHDVAKKEVDSAMNHIKELEANLEQAKANLTVATQQLVVVQSEIDAELKAFDEAEKIAVSTFEVIHLKIKETLK
jgi:hypothetical protein